MYVVFGDAESGVHVVRGLGLQIQASAETLELVFHRFVGLEREFVVGTVHKGAQMYVVFGDAESGVHVVQRVRLQINLFGNVLHGIFQRCVGDHIVLSSRPCHEISQVQVVFVHAQ